MRDRQPAHQQLHGRVQRARHEAIVELGRAQRAERVVAGEQLVGAVAAERDRDLLARVFAEQIGRQQRGVAHRLVELRRDLGQQRRGLLEREHVEVMMGAEMLRHLAPSSADSSKLASSKPMLKVWISERSMWRVASATTDDESIPPLRKKPSGTSPIRRRFTAALSSSTSCSPHSRSGFAGTESNGSITKSQYFWISMRCEATSKRSE